MFSEPEISHYQRHLQLANFGIEAQHKLKCSKVLCIGAGGLGSPLLLYLAAAGIGKIGVIDVDILEVSNLQRQIIFGYSDLGKSKVEAAKARLENLNPHIEIAVYQQNFSAKNALNITKPYDIIVDGSDNFSTRYLSNDVAFQLKIPNVYASIFQYEGQVSVFAPHIEGCCYRCMLPSPPSAEFTPT